MRRGLLHAVWITAAVLPGAILAQEPGVGADQPAWLNVLVFFVSIPYTLYLVFVEGQRLHLLPVPLLAIGCSLWSFLEWKRQRFWTPRIIHIMAILGLATIIMINVAWVRAGGEMWTQRYVVIAIFGLFPYVTYLLFLGPRFLGRRRAPAAAGAPMESLAELERSDGSDRASSWARSAPRRATGLRRALGVGALFAIGTVGLAIATAVGPVSDPRPDLAGLHNPESLITAARGVTKGDPQAQISIIEFGDYQCPGCATFAAYHQPRLDSAFVETGLARFVYFDLPLTTLHANAFVAARAARCAEDQGGYWGYQEALFRSQAEWSELAVPHDAFEEYAHVAGLDRAAFRACLDSDRHADVVQANDALAQRLGIRSTPTVIVLLDGAEPRQLREDTFSAIAATIDEMADAAR